MNWRGINQIGSYLNQSGVPAGQSQDIVVRLRQMIEAAIAESKAYSDGLFNQANGTSTGNADDDFFNEFKPPEQKPRDTAGENGKDGLPGLTIPGKGGDNGQDGTNGLDGPPGQDGDGIVVLNPGLGGISCETLKKKLEDCGLSTKKGDCDCSKSLECPPGSGIVRGQNICDVLDDHARMLKTIRERLDKIEKQLKEAVEC